MGEYLTIDPSYSCLRVEAIRAVDEVLNRGAIREAEEATDVLQAPEVLRDTRESSYVEVQRSSIEPMSAACVACATTVKVIATGTVRAPGCSVETSGKCEKFWMDKYPEKYRTRIPYDDVLRIGALPCHAEVNCDAKMTMDDGEAMMVDGSCKVDRAGRGWVERGRREYVGTKLNPPEEMAAFDGETL